jgi:hypothetical protein
MKAKSFNKKHEKKKNLLEELAIGLWDGKIT